jgi:hypothetical protein
MINPEEKRYQTSVVIADDLRGNIRGLAIMMFMSDLKFCYLDFLAVTQGRPTSGVGGTIYERVREEAVAWIPSAFSTSASLTIRTYAMISLH